MRCNIAREGQSIRATHALPRNGLFGWKISFESFASSSFTSSKSMLTSSTSNLLIRGSGNNRTSTQQGRVMGGCYLIGVTTNSFIQIEVVYNTRDNSGGLKMVEGNMRVLRSG